MSTAAAAAAEAAAAVEQEPFGSPAAADADEGESEDDEDAIIGGKPKRSTKGSPHDRLLSIFRGLRPAAVYSTFLLPLKADWESDAANRWAVVKVWASRSLKQQHGMQAIILLHQQQAAPAAKEHSSGRPAAAVLYLVFSPCASVLMHATGVCTSQCHHTCALVLLMLLYRKLVIRQVEELHQFISTRPRKTNNTYWRLEETLLVSSQQAAARMLHVPALHSSTAGCCVSAT